MQDKATGKSRGFGFVTYRYGESLEKAMSQRPHDVDGKRVDPKRAIPKELGKDAGKMDAYASVTKVFVGGIRDKPLTEDDLKTYFGEFGDVKDCVIMTDKVTKKSRGFAFVVFDDYDAVDKIVIQRFHVINGVNVEVKKAMPKEDSSAGSSMGGVSRSMLYHGEGTPMMGPGSRAAMHHYHAAYPAGYGHGGWGSGAYNGTPIMSGPSAPASAYGFASGPYAPQPTATNPYGGYNPRDLPTYGGSLAGLSGHRLFGSPTASALEAACHPRVGAAAAAHHAAAAAAAAYDMAGLANALPYPTSGACCGFGSNLYAAERR